MQTIKVTSSRRNIGNAKIGAMWQNTIRAGRKVIATITEPNTFNPGKYHVSAERNKYAIVARFRELAKIA